MFVSYNKKFFSVCPKNWDINRQSNNWKRMTVRNKVSQLLTQVKRLHQGIGRSIKTRKWRKTFWNETFRECLLEQISIEVFIHYNGGLKMFCEMLNQYAPQKKKYFWSNQKMPTMAKTVLKEIMKRSRLCNNFLRKRTEENK